MEVEGSLDSRTDLDGLRFTLSEQSGPYAPPGTVSVYAYFGDWHGDAYARSLPDGDPRYVGRLSVQPDQRIFVVWVKPDWRRRGIATAMLAHLRAAGYQVEHDESDLSDAGRAWARATANDGED